MRGERLHSVAIRNGAVGAVNGIAIGALLGIVGSFGGASLVLIGASCALAGAGAAVVLGFVLETTAR